MKKVFFFFILPSVFFLFSGCASYHAATLNNPSSGLIQTSKNAPISVVAQAFNRADCKKYLDRDVIKAGYRPIQLYIHNNSDKPYNFSLARLSLPCARPEEVARKVHTSTVGRAAGYGAAAWFTFGIFAIPAVVDGVKSAQANEALDHDFLSKAAKDELILPYSHLNKLIFVPSSEYQSIFTLTLLEENSSNQRIFNIDIK